MTTPRGWTGMEIPFDITAKLTIARLDAAGGILVLRDATGKLHIFEFAGTISNRPLTEAEKAYAVELIEDAA